MLPTYPLLIRTVALEGGGNILLFLAPRQVQYEAAAFLRPPLWPFAAACPSCNHCNSAAKIVLSSCCMCFIRSETLRNPKHAGGGAPQIRRRQLAPSQVCHAMQHIWS